MIRARMTCVGGMALVLAACPCYLAGEQQRREADTEELIKRLSSDDFETRERATTALAERAESIWDRLKELSQAGEPEVRARVRRAMAAPGQRRLTALLEAAKKELDAAAAAAEKDAAVTKAKEELESKNIQDAATALTALLNAPSEERKGAAFQAREKALRDAEDAAAKRLADLKAAAEARRKAERMKNNRLQTRVDQLRQALDEGGVLFEPGTPKEWDPALLPFGRRVKCRVSFEFVDVPLDDAVKALEAWSGVQMSIDNAVLAPTINLRVQDMSVDLALEWISKLADLDCRVDAEAQKILITKPKE